MTPLAAGLWAVAALQGEPAPAAQPGTASQASSAAPAALPTVAVVAGGIERDAAWSRKPEPLRSIEQALVVEGPRTVLWAPVALGTADFSAEFELMLPEQKGTGAGIRIDTSVFGIDGAGEGLYTAGPLFLGGMAAVDGSSGKVRAGVPFAATVRREGEWLECTLNGDRVIRTQVGKASIGRIGVWGAKGSIAVGSFSVSGGNGRLAPPEIVWSAGQGPWDEVASPSIAALADGSLIVTGAAVRSDDQGKDVRRVLVRRRAPSGTWSDAVEAAPVDAADAVAIGMPDGAVILLQSGGEVLAVSSADAGTSWSAPRAAVPGAKGLRIAGQGACVERDGSRTLCVPVLVESAPGVKSVALLRSADGGSGWSMGAALAEPAAGAALVEIGQGRIAIIGVRPGEKGRWMWTSEDLGAAWSAPMPCAGLDPGTARACAWRDAARNLVLVESARSAPNALRRWSSDDGGRTWIERTPIQHVPSGACAVALAPDRTAWLAHEGGDFARREHVLARPVR